MELCTTMDDKELSQRRAAARRTAWKLAFVAFVIFAAFLATGIVGR
jgi:hypothetical protein